MKQELDIEKAIMHLITYQLNDRDIAEFINDIFNENISPMDVMEYRKKMKEIFNV